MEPSSQPLATDSFSYSWLTNRKPSFDCLNEFLRPSFDNCDEAILKDFKQDLRHHHQNQNKINHQDFDFNVLPESKASDSLIHADDIFADGCIMPVYRNRYQAIISAPATPISSLASIPKRCERSPCCFLEKLKKSSNRVFKKSFSFLSKLVFPRDGMRVDDLDRKVKEIRRKQSNSNHPSPNQRAGADTDADADNPEKADAYKSPRNVRSCKNSPPLLMDPCLHVEYCSIDEAILHCKRSFASK